MRIFKWLTHPVFIFPLVIAVGLYWVVREDGHHLSLDGSAVEAPTVTDSAAAPSAPPVAAPSEPPAPPATESMPSVPATSEAPATPTADTADSAPAATAEVPQEAPAAPSVPQTLSGTAATATASTTLTVAPTASPQSAPAADEPTPEAEPASTPTAPGEPSFPMNSPFAAMAPLGGYNPGAAPAAQLDEPTPSATAPSAPATAPTPNVDTAAAIKAWREARQAAMEGHFDDAVAAYHKLGEIDPRNPDAYGELGNLYLMHHDTQSAAAAYLEAGRRLNALGMRGPAWRMCQLLQGLDAAKAKDLCTALGGK